MFVPKMGMENGLHNYLIIIIKIKIILLNDLHDFLTTVIHGYASSENVYAHSKMGMENDFHN